METIIVTGAAGFIGSSFVPIALGATSMRMVVVDKLTYAGSPLNFDEFAKYPRFEFVRADIADGRAMRELMAARRPLWVVNFAAESHVDRSIDGPGEFLRTNVSGTFELLEALRAATRLTDTETSGRTRFLQVSTDEVYGSLGATGAFSETTPYAPNSPYAASKAAADHFVRAWHETFGLATLTTNCSNNYGPRQFPEKLIPLMILNALEAKPLPIYGDGGNVRDWLFVEDHCEAILRVLQNGTPGRQYNVGGNCERTNLQVVDTLCAALDELAPAAHNAKLRARGLTSYAGLKTFVADRPGHDRRYAIDATRIRTELGWTPRHDFDSGLRRTVAWYLSNLDWCRAVAEGGYERTRLGLAPATEAA